jgi:hypothetical protein
VPYAMTVMQRLKLKEQENICARNAILSLMASRYVSEVKFITHITSIALRVETN